jgi:FAD/FMN-containing dehydrogenase
MNDKAVEPLSSVLRGNLLRPSDAGYQEARMVYNAMHDQYPALIVQAVDTADVAAAVNFARERELLLAVRGGGHSVPGFGTCDDGLVIDLGNICNVVVDASEKRVRVGGGCTLGGLDHATHAYGLAVPGGTVSTTGVAGLTLGGGMGHLSRHFGLSIDNLQSAEVVTAAGDIITCDADRHPELFWAIRGGGGNFGVVTSFEFLAHEVPTVLAGPTVFQVDGKVLRNWEMLMNKAPEPLNTIWAVALAPPFPFLAKEWHGQPVMIALSCWSGSDHEDDHIPGMMADLGDMIGQALWRMPYPQVNTFFDELLPPGLRHYWKANTAKGYSDEAIAAHLEHGPKVKTLESGNFVMPINGACHRVAEGETAFANRASFFSSVIAGTWHDPDEDAANIAWVRDYYAAMEPYSDPGGYVNFAGDEEQSRDAESTYGNLLKRLGEVKREYDPHNLFRVNQNIAPA